MMDNETYATIVGQFHLNENKRAGEGRSGKSVFVLSEWVRRQLEIVCHRAFCRDDFQVGENV
jgi:hypothetical protein